MLRGAVGGADAPKFTRSQWAAIGLYIPCQVLTIIDSAGINTALASMSRELAVPVSQTALINIGFLVAAAAIIPMSGWLGERVGTLRLLRSGLLLLAVGSVVSAAAGTIGVLVIGRVVQGLGTGGLAPLAMSVVARAFPPEDRLRANTILSVPIAAAPALGPLLGGYLTDALSWRWIFIVNLPLALVAAAMTFLNRETSERAVRALDVPGAILTLIVFGVFAYALDSLNGSTPAWIGAVGFAVSIVGFGVLVPWERRKGHTAFLDLRLLGRRLFSRSVLMRSLSSVGFVGFGFANPILLQVVLGLSATQAGVVGVGGAIGLIFTGPLAYPLITRLGARRSIALSQLLMIACLGIILIGYGAHSVPVIVAGWALLGASSFVSTMATQTVGFAAVPQANLGDATSLDGTARQMAAALGVAAASGAMAAPALLGLPTSWLVYGPLMVFAAFHLLTAAIAGLGGPMPLPRR